MVIILHLHTVDCGYSRVKSIMAFGISTVGDVVGEREFLELP